MVNIIYKKDLASSEIFDNYSLWRRKKLKKYVGIIYNFKNKAEPWSSGYVGQSGEGVDKFDIRLSTRPSQFQNFSDDFIYAGEKVNKKRKELPTDLWVFEALAVVEADTKRELEDILDELEKEFILVLDSVDNGYNSNYGGREGYKYKWKCYDTEFPKLKDIFSGFSLSSQGIDLLSNPEVYVFPRDRIENIDMRYIWFDNFKTKFNDLPEDTKTLITLYKDRIEIPKDNNNLYLFKCHLNSLKLFYSCNFNIMVQEKIKAFVKFKVHTEYHKTLSNIRKYRGFSEQRIASSIELEGWNIYGKTVLFVEKREADGYIFHHFKTIKDASDYTKRDYQAVVSAVREGLGGFWCLPNQSYCRAYFGNKFVKEYLSNY